MKIFRLICVVLTWCMAVVYSHAEVRLPHLISDGIVLQRNAPIRLWGWADARETVKVTFLGQTYTTKADRKGNWLVTLPAQPAGGPYTIQVNHLQVKDVLIGEVWLCSGQSNMETPMGRVAERFEEEVAAINNPMIRHFKTPLTYNVDAPQSDLKGGTWYPATQDHIMTFSATAYFFGKYLYDHFQVPIGLFNSSVGGSPVEAWLSPESAKQFPTLEHQLAQLHDQALQDSIRRMMSQGFQRPTPPVDAGAGVWQQTTLDDSDWGKVYLPGYFGEKEVAFNNGVIWLRKHIDVPAGMVGQPGYLRLGTLIDNDSAFVNGVYVGNTTYQYPPRKYAIPARLLNQGMNVIAIRMGSNSRGGFVEEKPYKLVVGDQSIDLTGEWKYKVGYNIPPMPRPTGGFQAPNRARMIPPPVAGQNSPTALYNAMIAPALPYVIRGVLWYQGEANAGRASEYAAYFEALVSGWRQMFGQPDLPFIYVQLPNYQDPERYQANSSWAALRDVQRRALSIPHTGMAIAMGLGEWNDIHPLNKRDLGYRIALVARQVAYGETGFVSNGPLYQSIRRTDDGSLILTFSSVGSGIDANLRLRGFVIAGANGQYVEAEATPIAPNQVRVWSNAVRQPVSVRYAWAQNPIDANLRNKAGLPASPFEATLQEISQNSNAKPPTKLNP